MNLTPVWLTLQLAGISSLLLILIAIPLAWWLAHTRSRLRSVISAFVALPLVLPPTVLGFYLLLAFAEDGPIGWITEKLGLGALAFRFPGLVLGSMVYSLPFVVGPIQQAFESTGKGPLELAATFGMSPAKRFFKISLPLAKPGLISAFVLGFAHTLGEFGVVLLIGGNIPGETRVLSIAIYDYVETLEYAKAHYYSIGMLLFSFVVLWFVYAFRKTTRVSP